MNPKKGKHFSFNIGIHLFSVLVVLAVAFLVGYSTKESQVNFHGFLATTISTNDGTSSSLPEVTFSVIPGVMAECDLVLPRTPVLFSVNKSMGGAFLLSSELGERSLFPGEHPLPNATYHWSAIVNSGYVGSGALSGDFVLNNPCPQTSEGVNIDVPTTGTTDTVTPVTGTTDTTIVQPSPVLDAAILPGVWYMGNKISSGATIAGSPTLRIFAPGAINVAFKLAGVNSLPQTFTEQNGVTRISGTDAWSIDFTQMKILDGAYKVAAYYETSAGKYFTDGVYFTIKRAEILSSLPATTSTTITPITAITSPSAPVVTSTVATPSAFPRPTLRIFVENTPVTDLSHAFSYGEVEFRVAVPSGTIKRMTLLMSSSTTVELGGAVRDDLLSMDKDVWSFVWDIKDIQPGVRKVWARIVTTDNRFVETDPIIMNIDRTPSREGPIVGDAKEGTTATSGTMDIIKQDEVLARVTAPELCMNREECRLYCASHPEEKERCALFARVALERTMDRAPSFTDGIDPLRLEAILNDQRRSREIPEVVSTPEQFRDFCTELSNASSCMKVLVRNDLATEETLGSMMKLVTRAKEEERRVLVERIGARVFVDNDMDGITDYDEVNIYRTDPSDQDTDHDGFPDGAEIMAHTNPLGGKNIKDGTSSTTILRDEFVRMESPRISGTMLPALLAVEGVAMVEDLLLDNNLASSSKLTFRGRATPNTFLTLYIFSDPIMVTIKTDESGAWTYTLDKSLADGSHEIYSAITDSGGHILAKSEPLPFVKEAFAVSVGGEALLPGNSEPGFFSGASLYAFIAIIIGILGVAFSIIGFMVRRRETENLPLDPSA